MTFETRTPSDGSGDFTNDLDPHLELFDALGQSVVVVDRTDLPDGRNESITVPAGAEYLIKVTGEGGTAGEDILIDPPVEARATVPALAIDDDLNLLAEDQVAGSIADTWLNGGRIHEVLKPRHRHLTKHFWPEPEHNGRRAIRWLHDEGSRRLDAVVSPTNRRSEAFVSRHEAATDMLLSAWDRGLEVFE